MKKRNKKTKIRILYLLIFFTSILLTTTTYAWFSTTKIVSIETFNIHVASDGGIQISSDGLEWKAILELSDLHNAKQTYINSINQLPSDFEPVSTAGTIENGRLTMFSGDVTNKNNDYILVSSKLEETGNNENAKFIAFDIFLKAESKKTLYLNSNSSVENISEKSIGIENAFRVAFLNQGTVASDSSIYTIQNLNGSKKAFIWEPNYDTHTQKSIQNAKQTYGINLIEKNNKLIPYYGVKKEIKQTDNVYLRNTYTDMYQNFFEKVNIDLATTKDYDTNKYMFDINPGITKLRVYMWLEGQDLDCEDSASLGDVLINLQITTIQ